jgi:hypothetical protein
VSARTVEVPLFSDKETRLLLERPVSRSGLFGAEADRSPGDSNITYKINVIFCCQIKEHQLKKFGNESEISF